jgi:hypothetical protein
MVTLNYVTYRRVRIDGGWFFFAVTLADRSSDLSE